MGYDQLTDEQRAELERAATLLSVRLGQPVSPRQLFEAVKRTAAVIATLRDAELAGEWGEALPLDVGAIRTPPYN